MARIIEKHDNDKEYIFTCPVCGTIFTDRMRNIDTKLVSGSWLYGEFSYRVDCPNCDKYVEFKELTEYNEE